MKKFIWILIVVVFIISCGSGEVLSPPTGAPKASQVSPPSANQPRPTEKPSTISAEEAKEIVSACNPDKQVDLGNEKILFLCRTEKKLDSAALALIPVAGIALASPVPGDEVVVGAILTGAKITQLVVVAVLVTAPKWVPLLTAIPQALQQPSAVTNTAESAQAGTGKPQQKKKVVAFINDDADFASTRVELLQLSVPSLVDFVIFPNCEDLIAAMDTDYRFDVYIVDFNLGKGKNGATCTEEILALHPGAIVIGSSSDGKTRDSFIESGARDFINAKEGAESMANLLRGLLP